MLKEGRFTSVGEDLHTCIITLVPSGVRQSFPCRTMLSDALFDMGVMVKTPCGGRGTCGKCRVILEGGPGEVLACRTSITNDLMVRAQTDKPFNYSVLPEIKSGVRIAAAVDIGTTTVKMSLVDITRRTAFEIGSFFNPQQRFGHDVISRIAAGADPSVLLALKTLIRKGVRICLEGAFNELGLAPERLERIVFSGNTTMLYLLFGLDVQPLGRYPYTASSRDFPELNASDLDLPAFVCARVSALGVFSAFIGADIIGGLTLVSDMGIAHNTLFLDLGTNGELFFLGSSKAVHVTSCAMGPALEGMNISWGMTACEGAITSIRRTPSGLDYDMVGPGIPSGITGTALVDLMAILLDEGIITPSGLLQATHGRSLGQGIPEGGTDSSQLRLWGDIRLTRKDIRNVQLAKAASLTAARLLLKVAGCDPASVEHVFIAGALGGHLVLKNFLRLGFIPDFPNADYLVLGNTSLKAAEAACMDQDFLQRFAELRGRAEEVVLSCMPGFQDEFIGSLNFPQHKGG